MSDERTRDGAGRGAAIVSALLLATMATWAAGQAQEPPGAARAPPPGAAPVFRTPGFRLEPRFIASSVFRTFGYGGAPDDTLRSVTIPFMLVDEGGRTLHSLPAAPRLDRARDERGADLRPRQITRTPAHQPHRRGPLPAFRQLHTANDRPAQTLPLLLEGLARLPETIDLAGTVDFLVVDEPTPVDLPFAVMDTAREIIPRLQFQIVHVEQRDRDRRVHFEARLPAPGADAGPWLVDAYAADEDGLDTSPGFVAALPAYVTDGGVLVRGHLGVTEASGARMMRVITATAAEERSIAFDLAAVPTAVAAPGGRRPPPPLVTVEREGYLLQWKSVEGSVRRGLASSRTPAVRCVLHARVTGPAGARFALEGLPAVEELVADGEPVAAAVASAPVYAGPESTVNAFVQARGSATATLGFTVTVTGLTALPDRIRRLRGAAQLVVAGDIERHVIDTDEAIEDRVLMDGITVSVVVPSSPRGGNRRVVVRVDTAAGTARIVGAIAGRDPPPALATPLRPRVTRDDEKRLITWTISAPRQRDGGRRVVLELARTRVVELPFDLHGLPVAAADG